MTFYIENPITRLNNEIAGLNNEIAGLNNEIAGLNNENEELNGNPTNSQIEILEFNKEFGAYPEEDPEVVEVAEMVGDKSKLTDKEIIGASLEYSTDAHNNIILGGNTSETINDTETINNLLNALNDNAQIEGFLFFTWDENLGKIKITKPNNAPEAIVIHQSSSIMSYLGFDTNSDLVISGQGGSYETAPNPFLPFSLEVNDTLIFTPDSLPQRQVNFSILEGHFYNDLLTTPTYISGENKNITLSAVSPFNKVTSNSVFIKRLSRRDTLHVTLKLIVQNIEQQQV